MKTIGRFLTPALGLSMGVILCGCHRHAEDEHAHAPESAGVHDPAHEGHSHGTRAPDGTVRLTPDTREILQLGVAPVTGRLVPRELPINVQIFGENHRPGSPGADDHSECEFQGSAFLPPEAASRVKTGAPVRLTSPDGARLAGMVLGVHPAQAIGEAEVVVGITNVDAALRGGEFLKGIATLGEPEQALVVPGTAVLRTVDGTFVYVAREDGHFTRVAVTTGAETGGDIPILSGVREGDLVATNGVETIRLIELHAARGGGHGHTH